MSIEKLIKKFNEKFPVGALVYWRSVGSDGVDHLVYTVEAEARDQHGQAVAWLEERSGCVSIEESFVDYSRVPAEKEPLESYDLCEHVGPRPRVQLSRRCAKCQMEVDRKFDSFWRPIIYPNGQFDVEEMKANLNDYEFLMEQASSVYSHVTGGAMSKTNYFAESVIQQADKEIEKQIAEGFKEEKENLQEDLNILENCVNAVSELFCYQEEDLRNFVPFISWHIAGINKQFEKYKIALADAIRAPMGVLPASAEGLLTDKDLREAEARRTNKPFLNDPCAECKKPVGTDYSKIGEGEHQFIVCGSCECNVQETWEEFKDAHRNGEI